MFINLNSSQNTLQDQRVAARVEKIIRKIETHKYPVRDMNVPYFTGRYGPHYLKHEEY